MPVDCKLALNIDTDDLENSF